MRPSMATVWLRRPPAHSRRSRSAASRSCHRARAGRSVRTALAWAGVALLVLIGSAAGGAYLWFHQSVAEVVASDAGRQGRGEAARHRAARPARDGARGSATTSGPARAKGTQSRSDTIMLVRADPETKSISMLSSPCATSSSRSTALESRPSALGSTRRTRPAAERDARDRPKLTGVPVNYLITVNFRGFRSRQPARRRLAGRRPALLQRPRRRLRLRHDQPLPRLPASRRLAGARLRPLPPHGFRSLPGRTPAAVRARVQGPDQGEHRLRSSCRR